MVISVPKIFVNGKFYFNLSSKMWSHVFFGTQCIAPLLELRHFIDCLVTNVYNAFVPSMAAER